MTEKKPHHHGNLRTALIEAGLAILREDGLDGLTLRRAAARAGVSHAAPAHHFDGKQGLLTALAAHGFEVFTACMRAERHATGSTPKAQLEGICRGYLQFAETEDALFRLIFATEHKDYDDPHLIEASSAAYGELSDVCALFEPAPSGAYTNETAVWSLVHGYAMLRAYGQGGSPETGAPVPFEVLLERLALEPRSP